MVDAYNFTVYDYDEESSGGMLHIANLSAGNFAAQEGFANAFRTALNGIILSTVSKDSMRNVITDSVSFPSDPFAQREIKWQMTVEDAVTQKLYQYEYPTADLSLLENNSPYIVKNGAVVITTGAAAVQAFVDAVEDFALSPDGNPVSVRTIEQVGRNL